MKTGATISFLLYISLLVLSRNMPGFEARNTAADPLGELSKGNERFSARQALHPHASAQRLQEVAAAQHPIAAVVCCSDSRVPPEIIFDQGLGDLFVVRTAGNLLGGLEIGSIEYAVEHLGVKQVIVMGHRDCGAIKAFISHEAMPGHIRDVVDSIAAEEEIRAIPPDDKNLLQDCVQANIRHGIRQLQQSPLLTEKMNKRELQITGACYDLKKGCVDFIDR